METCISLLQARIFLQTTFKSGQLIDQAAIEVEICKFSMNIVNCAKEGGKLIYCTFDEKT